MKTLRIIPIICLLGIYQFSTESSAAAVATAAMLGNNYAYGLRGCFKSHRPVDVGEKNHDITVVNQNYIHRNLLYHIRKTEQGSFEGPLKVFHVLHR